MEFKEIYKLEFTDGRYRIVNQKGFDRDCQALQPASLQIVLSKYKPKRSNPQNRFFHGVLIPIIQNRLLELGWEQALSKEWVKDYIKVKCLLVDDVDPLTGEVYQKLGETSELSKGEFMDFMARIYQFCAEWLDLPLPDPGEQTDLNFDR